MSEKYKVTSLHVETTSEGRLVEPGEFLSAGENFDPKAEENRRLIEEGVLVKVPGQDAPEPEPDSPAARRAKELGATLSEVEGTGQGGNVTVKDVEAHVRAKGGAVGDENNDETGGN